LSERDSASRRGLNRGRMGRGFYSPGAVQSSGLTVIVSARRKASAIFHTPYLAWGECDKLLVDHRDRGPGRLHGSVVRVTSLPLKIQPTFFVGCIKARHSRRINRGLPGEAFDPAQQHKEPSLKGEELALLGYSRHTIDPLWKRFSRD